MSRINRPTHSIRTAPPIELDNLSLNDQADSGSMQRESARLLYEMMRALNQKGGESNSGLTSGNVMDSPLAVDIHTTKRNHDVSIKNKLIGLDAPGPPPPSARSGFRLVWFWAVLAFVTGSVCYGVTLQLAQQFIPKIKLVSAPGAMAAPIAASASSWIETVTDYQKFYTRETFTGLRPGLAQYTSAINELRAQNGLAIQEPNFRAAGFTVKGVQRLSFNGQALIQIVYLPKSSAPVSLYVIKEAYPDETASQKRVGALSVISWRRNTLRYALIGEPEIVDLAVLGKIISIPNSMVRNGRATPR
jgi:hypothetical protein